VLWCNVRRAAQRNGRRGSAGRTTGDVRPRRVLRLDPRLVVVACLFWRSFRCTSLPIFTLEVRPLAWSGLSLREVPGGPTLLGRACPTPHHWDRAWRTRLILYPWYRARRPCPSPVPRIGLSVPLPLVGCLQLFDGPAGPSRVLRGS
jgi:hypothetical protein